MDFFFMLSFGAFVFSGRTIGFSGTKSKTLSINGTVLNHLLPEDLHKYGMIPEFVGRFQIQTYVEPLKKEDLVRILTDPVDSVVNQYQQLLAMDGIDLRFTSGALDAIAGYAIQMGTGARGLRNIIEKVMRDVMFDAPSKKLVTTRSSEYVVTEALVKSKTAQLLNVG